MSAAITQKEIDAIRKMAIGFKAAQARGAAWREEQDKLSTERIAKNERFYAVWTTLDGVDVLQVPGDCVAAFPASGKRGSRVYVVFDVNTREELCQLKKNEVNSWLFRHAQSYLA